MLGEVLDLVRDARRNVQAFASAQCNLLGFDCHDRFSGENEEELLGVLMIVAGFGGGGRHLLLDHTPGGIFHQVPAVATLSPSVVIGIGAAGWFHGLPHSRIAY